VTQKLLRALVCGLLIGGAGLASAKTPEETFNDGNDAYARGDFDAAAEAYRTVLKYGITDARVEYNLGNAAFRLGRLGEAVLHYRRAQRLAPADADIAANLELALQRGLDRVDPPEVTGPVRAVRAVQDRLGPDRQALALLLLLWVAAGIVAWRSARPGGWSAAWGWTLAAVLSIAALGCVSWYTTWQRLDGESLGVVLQPSVEVLAGAGQNNATLFTVHEGLTVVVQQEQRDWLQVTLPNGLHGWVPREALGLV
jgi:hypothetical protein